MIISIPRSTPRQLAPALMVWLAAALIVVFVSNISRVLAQGTDEQPPKRLALRLRSFIPNAGGSLYFEPTLSGGVVRLTAIGLPAPEQIRPDGVAFFVWTVAAGEAPVRIGELVTDNNGNGGLSFA